MLNKPSKTSLRNSSRRGSALLAVVIFGIILTVCAVFAYRSTIFQRLMAERSQDYMAALAVAEAGAELAMAELNKPTSATPAPFGSWTGTGDKTYSEAVRDKSNNRIGETVVKVSALESGLPKIIATGYVPNKNQARVMRTVQLSAKADTVPAPFGQYGIFSYKNISINGGGTFQSYNSSEWGGYWPASLGHKAGVAAVNDITMNGGGYVHGNVQAGGNLVINGNLDVTGEKISKTKPTAPPAIPKPSFSTEIPATDNNANIDLRDTNGVRERVHRGSSVTTNGNYDLTFPAPGNYVINQMDLNGSGAIKITGTGDVNIFVKNNINANGVSGISVSDGANVRLMADHLNFNGSQAFNFNGKSKVDFVVNGVTFNGTSQLKIPGNQSAVRFYIDKNLNFNGAATHNNDIYALPSNLQLFVGKSLNFNGSMNFVGCIYAPNANLNFNGACVYRGALVAGNIGFNGATNFYLDETVTKPTGGSGAYVTSWLEKSPLRL